MELSFDTDQGRAMMRKLLTSHDQINQQVNEAKRLCDELTASNWQAPAAGQFNTAVTGWTTNMKPTLIKLADARRRLELEIREWEQTAQDFEGGAGFAADTSDISRAPGGAHYTTDTSDTSSNEAAAESNGVKGKVDWTVAGSEGHPYEWKPGNTGKHVAEGADTHDSKKPSISIGQDLVNGSVFSQRAGPAQFDELGGQAGWKVGYGPKGVNAGLTAEAYAAKVSAEGTYLGDKNLGLNANGEAKFASAEANAGIIDNSLGANVEATLASAEGGTGVQTAYGDIGVHGGIRAGLKFGGRFGEHTEVSLGPVTVGVDIKPDFGAIGSGIADGWDWLTD